MKTKRVQSQEWWHSVAAEEKEVIRDVLRVMRGLKLSKSPVMARAATKWERSIAYFIKWQLQNGAGRARRA